MCILNNREVFFNLSKISAIELREKLKVFAGLKYENKPRMLQQENVYRTVLSIIENREGDLIAEIKFNLNDQGTVRRINEWLDDLRVNGIAHPELWTVCARYLMRALRGELKDGRQEYPSHLESKKRLMEYIC